MAFRSPSIRHRPEGSPLAALFVASETPRASGEESSATLRTFAAGTTRPALSAAATFVRAADNDTTGDWRIPLQGSYTGDFA